MVDTDDINTPVDVVETLADFTGQSYLLADDGFEIIEQFAPLVTDSYAAEMLGNDPDEADNVSNGKCALALSHAVEQVQRPAAEARGLVNAAPHQQILVVTDLSNIVVKAMGDDPSTATALGGGTTKDIKHEDNIETLRKALDLATEA